jgi:hypothetical protein
LVRHLVYNVLVRVHGERNRAVTQRCAGDRWVHALFEHHRRYRMAAVVKASLWIKPCFGHEPLGGLAEGVGTERTSVAAVADKVEVVPGCSN